MSRQCPCEDVNGITVAACHPWDMKRVSSGGVLASIFGGEGELARMAAASRWPHAIYGAQEGHGQLGDAFKSYVRTRDYCTSAKHIVTMCLNAILVSIEMGKFSHVKSYIRNEEQTPEALDPTIIAKLHCAAGLAHLESKKYKFAARKFFQQFMGWNSH